MEKLLKRKNKQLDPIQFCRKGLEACLQRLESLIPALKQRIVTDLSKDPIYVLSNAVPRLQQTYTVATKQPTTFSPYVLEIFQYPRTFLFQSNEINSFLSLNERIPLMTLVAEQATTNYRIYIIKLLELVRNTYAALKGLRKGKGTDDVGVFGSSDKIKMQLQLDIKKYYQELSDVGIQTDSSKLLDLLSSKD